MTPTESILLWQVVDQARVIRQLEAAMKLLAPIEGDITQHEARYQRTLQDTGLSAQAKEIEGQLSNDQAHRPRTPGLPSEPKIND
jgi:hypothetical protein